MAIFFILMLVNAGPDTLWRTEYNYVLRGLELMNLTPADLAYDKQWIPDSFRLKIVSDLMNRPLEVPDYVLRSGRAVANCVKAADYLAFTGRELTGKTIAADAVTAADLETAIRDIFAKTEARLEKAFQGLSPAQRDSLIFTAPALWADEADSLVKGYAGALQKEFGDKYGIKDTLRMVDVLRLSKKIDVAELHAAGKTLVQGVEGLMPLLGGLIKSKKPEPIRVDGVEGDVYAVFDLPGKRRAVIGGPGRNVYTGDFCAIIDLGGNDVYEGRAAGAIGELGTPVSFVLDLAGDDTYRNHDKLVNQGAALFGVALLWDLSGSDSYTAFHIAQGAGLYGIGMLIDEQGDDTYRAGYFCQAAGNFGSGILIDHRGNDDYRAFSWAQGMGGPWGYGLLFEEEGNDVYYAGGQYLHMPLDPDQYRSFAQGFGFGWRDVASGGIGFLYDRQGNDKYISEVYGQATSYWFALGMLLDEQGNDLYSAAQYSQGAGIHLSVGALLDREGDDHYFSRYGPAQGEGHDLAVGWLLDQDGDDVYYASGGQGIGLTNSVGIFVDTRGSDDYCSREGLSEGGANPSRGTGGIGLFIDLQGDDRYAEKGKGENNHVWTSGITGLGMDLEAVAPKQEAWEDTTAVFPELDTMRTDSAKITQLFHYASLWQVRADIGKVRTARRMLKDHYGPRAVRHVFKYEFVTYDGLVYEAIEPLFKAFKDTAATCLYQGLHALNDTIVRNSIYFLGRLEVKDAADTLCRMLAEPKNDTLAGSLIVALGTIKEPKAVPYIMKYANNSRERTRLRVMVALADIKDTLGIPTLVKGLSDPSFIVRTGAQEALAKFGAPALKPLEDELTKARLDGYRTTLLLGLRKVFGPMEIAAKTGDLKKRLAGDAEPYLAAVYPPLKQQAQKLVADVGGQSSLSPEELFLLPEGNE
jgi:hypothetical protein